MEKDIFQDSRNRKTKLKRNEELYTTASTPNAIECGPRIRFWTMRAR